jgi:hypothetical protein
MADSSADEEEQEWLNALEAGDLDENGELKRERDPSILTARQASLKYLLHSTLRSVTLICHLLVSELDG